MKAKPTSRNSKATTANALLGLLTIAPMSGYDIRGLIERSIGHFWSESYGQIYPSLRQLESQKLVEKKTRQREGRPERNVFRLTKKGREQLSDWLAQPPAVEVPRSELLLKLFFGLHAPEGASRLHLEQFREAHRAAQAQYIAMEHQLQQEESADPQLPYWLMTLSFGRHRSQAFIDWANETLEKLDKAEPRGRKRSSK